MSAPSDPAGGPSSSRPSDETSRRLVAHLRHELRTSLTAVIGYSEHLAESAPPGAPEELTQTLDHLRAIGAAVLELVNERLGADAVNCLDKDALPRAVLDLGAACQEPASRIAPTCAGLIALCEREGLYDLIPTLCRIQASGVMLNKLLESYSLDLAKTALPSGLIGDPIAPRSIRAVYPAPAEPRGRILIADDNSISRDVLRQWLERKGHEVDEASGGEAALALMRSSDYDLVLLDLVMPDMSGLSVLETLRQEGRLGQAPIVMLSASDEINNLVHCIEQGADDYVLKPFNRVLLGARIRACLELKRHRERERAYLAMLKELREKARGGEPPHENEEGER